MTGKKERLQAAFAGEVADRLPVALWRHFPVDDQDSRSLAETTLAFQRQFDFDFVKVSPASSFCLKDWGAEDVWEGATEGTRRYTRRVIQEPADWARLPKLDENAPGLAAQLDCLARVIEGVEPGTPIVQTVFSPLAQAKNLAGEARLLEHLHRHPDSVLQGLATIADTTRGFVEAVQRLGADGIFYAVQHASDRYFDGEGYQRFGGAFDLPLLEVAGGMWCNVLHLHGAAVHFEVAERYPVQVVNWHDRETPPSLAEARGRLRGKAACGGLRREETMVLGDPERVRAEAADALGQVSGKGLVLGTGCVTPVHAPWSNLRAARLSVEDCA